MTPWRGQASNEEGQGETSIKHLSIYNLASMLHRYVYREHAGEHARLHDGCMVSCGRICVEKVGWPGAMGRAVGGTSHDGSWRT